MRGKIEVWQIVSVGIRAANRQNRTHLYTNAGMVLTAKLD